MGWNCDKTRHFASGASAGPGVSNPPPSWRWVQLKDGEIMSSDDIAGRVQKIVVEHLGVEESKVSETASFIDDLGADSLDTVELVMAFEEEFGCEIPDDAAEKIVTVKDAISFIQEHA